MAFFNEASTLLTQHHNAGSDRHAVIEVDDFDIQHADASRR
jgi:hypothetical protein